MGRKPNGGEVEVRRLQVQDLAGEQKCIAVRRECADVDEADSLQQLMRLHNQQAAVIRHLAEIDDKENQDHRQAGEIAVAIAQACDRLEETLLAKLSGDIRASLAAFCQEIRSIAAPPLATAA